MKLNFLAVLAILLSCSDGQGQYKYSALSITDPRVRKDLKLTSQQAAELKKILEANQRAEAKKHEESNKNPQYVFDPLNNGPARIVRLDDEAEKLQTEVTKLLTKSQLRRLDELWVQSQGINALLNPQFAERLNLDEATFLTIKQLLAERDQENIKLASSFFNTNRSGILNTAAKQQSAAKSLQASMGEAKRKYETEVLRLLTKKQRATFMALHGEPLKPDVPETASGEPAKGEASSAPTNASQADGKK